MAEVKGALIPTLPGVEDRPTQQCVDALAEAIKRLASSPILFGSLVQVKQGAPGTFTLTHGLGRIPQGYLVAKLLTALPDIPTLVSSTTTTITLTFHQAFTGALWVF